MKIKENKIFRYAMTIEFLGTIFAGSQIQPGQITVQSELEHAVNILTKENIKVIFAGRTDSGVHARCQFVHFDTNQEIDKKRFLYSLNAILPDEISVKDMAKIDKNFHVQKSAAYRWYRYMIYNSACKSVLLKDITSNTKENLNVEKMQKAILYLMGTHDFSSFKSSNTDNPAKECNILYVNCRKFSDIIYIDLIANRFLYNMVRIIMGTLIKIGNSSYKAEHILDVLKAKNRANAGPTAEARGLTLMGVGYPEKYNLNELIKMEKINEQNLLCKAS